MRLTKSVLVGVIAIVAGLVASPEARSPRSAANGVAPVEFTNCIESIGVTLVATESARAHVPAAFVLAGDGQPVTPLVVRTARCGISVEGGRSRTGTIVQIGAVIVPPDFTGDINNYTIWYYTNDLALAIRLLIEGVAAQYVPTIDETYRPNTGALDVQVPLPGVPRLEVAGTVMASSVPAGSFTANWWQATHAGTVKMSTEVPVIKIGGADLVLTTHRLGPLGDLIGGSAIGFPIIQQFNTFATAHLQLTTQ
jgi:hypothetical protein